MGISKIRLIKWFDRLFGGLAVRLLPRTRVRSHHEITRVLVIRPGGIGDAVLLVPALKTLCAALPALRITVLAERRNAAVFAMAPFVARVLLYDRPTELLAALSGRYDLVIDTEQWYRFSAVVARLCGAPLSIGFATNERQRLFSHPVPYSQEDYEADSFLHLLEPLAVCSAAPPELSCLEIPAAARERAVALLGPLAGTPFVAIFPGASIPERRWGVAPFRRLAELLKEDGLPVVVVGGPTDRESADAIVQGGLGLSLAGSCSLAESAAVIAQSRLLVSGDSGILHVGVCVGAPTVSLFGPGIRGKWGPRGGAHRVVERGCPCSPCTLFGNTPPCPHEVRCLREISAEDVYAAIRSLVS